MPVDPFEADMKRLVASITGELDAIVAACGVAEDVGRVAVISNGVPTTVKGIATVLRIPPNTFQITPHDKASITGIERALTGTQSTGAKIENDGVVIRLVYPSLTAERKKQLVRAANACAETGRRRIQSLGTDMREEIAADEQADPEKASLCAGRRDTVDSLVKTSLGLVGSHLTAAMSRIDGA
jgi:ribosome recycling factor